LIEEIQTLRARIAEIERTASTDRKLAVASREANEQFRVSLEAMPLPVSIVRIADGTLLFGNSKFAKSVGATVENLVGRKAEDFYYDVAERAGILDRLAREGSVQDYELRGKRLDGTLIWVLISVETLTYRGEPALFSSYIDITEQKRVEAQRDGHRQVLEQLAARSSISQILETLTRTVERQFEGTLCSVLLLDDDGERLRHGAAPSLPDVYIQAVDGLRIGPKVGACGRAMFTGQRVICENLRTDPYWKDLHPLATRQGLLACWSQPIVSSADSILGAFAMYYRTPRSPNQEETRSIELAAHLAGLAIERKRAEVELEQYHTHLAELVDKRTRQLEKSRQQLRQAERLASLGTLAAGIAHEINNPIGATLIAAQTGLRTMHQPNPPMRTEDAFQMIIDSSKRCARIVKSVLQFAQQAETEKWASDPNQIAQRSVELTTGYAEEHDAALQLELADGLPEIVMNPLAIEQVLINLIRNGIQAGNGDIRVSVTTDRVDDMVRYTVRDNGCGITDKNMQHMFEPFFTTRENEGGTGLGLSVVHGIIGEHGGTVEVDSRMGEGTTVRVFLPVDSPSPQDGQAASG
jgi:hypothetical protein